MNVTTVKDDYNGEETFTTDMELMVGRFIEFEDPETERLCIESFDYDDDGHVSEEEAASNTYFNPRYIQGNDKMTKFNELRYFKNIEVFGNSVFLYCTNLTEITLPESIKIIRPAAFAECHNLKKINIPAGIEKIYACAFNMSTNLEIEHLDFPNLELIERYAFPEVKKLKSVTFGKKIKKILFGAIYCCPILEKITFTGEFPPECPQLFCWTMLDHITIMVPKEHSDKYHKKFIRRDTGEYTDILDHEKDFSLIFDKVLDGGDCYISNGIVHTIWGDEFEEEKEVTIIHNGKEVTAVLNDNISTTVGYSLTFKGVSMVEY